MVDQHHYKAPWCSLCTVLCNSVIGKGKGQYSIVYMHNSNSDNSVVPTLSQGCKLCNNLEFKLCGLHCNFNVNSDKSKLYIYSNFLSSQIQIRWTTVYSITKSFQKSNSVLTFHSLITELQSTARGNRVPIKDTIISPNSTKQHSVQHVHHKGSFV